LGQKIVQDSLVFQTSDLWFLTSAFRLGGITLEQMALYREWRPQNFGQVIGQEHVCRTLKNAVQVERIAHAYLFCGPRGTGKTSTARILAKALNCQSLKNGEPCNNCPSCLSITEGISLSVIEMDAASHRGIEEIRDLRQKVGMAPSGGRYKVYIIDEVHMLTGEAFNALLKTLEEPPVHAVFILATTEAHKVPLTIVSRCQRFDFRRLNRSLIKDHLGEVAKEKNWSVEDEALELISRQAGGALRDALGLLDQAASFADGQISRQDIELLTGALGDEELERVITRAAQGDVPAVLQQLDVIFSRGIDPRQLLLQLADRLRELIFIQNIDKKQRIFYARLLRGIALVEGEMKHSSRPDLLLELALLRLTAGSDRMEQTEENLIRNGNSSRTSSRPELGVREQAATAQPSPTAIKQGGKPEGARAGGQGQLSQGNIGKDEEGRVRAGGHLERPEGTAQQTESKMAEIKTPENKRKREALSSPKEVLPSLEKAADVGPKPDRPEPDLGAIQNYLIKSAAKQPILSRVLAQCKLIKKGESILLLAPPFCYDLIIKEDNLNAVKESLQQSGCSLQLEVGLAEEKDSPAAKKKEQREAEPGRETAKMPAEYSEKAEKVMEQQDQDSELLNITLSLFNGKVIKKMEDGE
jgi:DNA polymerase-3 subunit gamma/tau